MYYNVVNITRFFRYYKETNVVSNPFVHHHFSYSDELIGMDDWKKSGTFPGTNGGLVVVLLVFSEGGFMENVSKYDCPS